jgi:predicted Rossmann-fold nucleotide-binding protein
MKREVDTPQKVVDWLARPEPAVFQGQDLREHSSELAAKPLTGCVFLGCRMQPKLAEAAAAAGCFIIPRREDLPFDPFTPGLYTPDELFDSLAQGGEYKNSLDRKVYESYINPDTKEERPVDADVLLLRRLHDASISEALDDVLDDATRMRTVAIMGGHDVPRNEPTFATVARLALDLATSGYLVMTGGGPGLMEAGNLGAYCAGFPEPVKLLEETLAQLKGSPLYSDKNWLTDAYKARARMGKPTHPAKSRNIGIPTWFYGHEPPNVFATDIAKYFENSVREEGLLAVALGGVIFAEGNGGTVQEIFQDACQNYYRTYKKKKSPMVLFGVDYWNPAAMVLDDPKNKKKKVYPVLEKLAAEKGFRDYLLLTDKPDEILEFIKSHPPA